MSGVPPKFEEKSFAGFMGRPLRDVWIAGTGALLGMILALGMPGPLWLRVFVGILVAGAGLVVGFGRVEGVWRFEEVALEYLRFRHRARRRVWRKPGEGLPLAVEVEEAPPRVSADVRMGVPPSPLDLAWGMVTVFVMAVMALVSVWLGQGGVHDLILVGQFLLRR